MIIVPPIDYGNVLPSYEPTNSTYTITDMILTFFIDVFNGMLKVSTKVIEFMTTTYQGIQGSGSALDFMFGEALPTFLAFVFVAWIIDIFG